MRVVALVSGGKDSCYSMQLCKQHGHDIVALANLLPEESAPDELDSFCFQTVGHQLIGAYASCMGLPLFRKRISGTSSVQDLGYSPTEGDEVEDLYQLLAYVKENVPGIQAVASGAIASDYQRLRVENVCSRLNLVSLAYLWHQPQRLLLRGMVESGVEAILVKVACLGLNPRKHLGCTINAMEPTLLSLADAYGCNVCGEGGEYETLTLDCPVFTRGRIELDESEVVHGTSDVAHLVPKAFRVVAKPGWEGCELPSDVRLVPGDYVAAPRASRLSASQLPSLAAATASATASGGGGAAGANSIAAAAVGSGGSTAAAVAAACVVDSLLQPAAPSSFHVHVSMCSGPDYVQLLCRAVRPRSALPSDLTECDTTAALHALLATAEQELASQSMDLHHCLFVHLFLANMGHFQAANGVYCKHFPCRDPPSRACVQVCLPHDCPVMCEFLLARGAAPPAAPPRSSLSAACPPPPPSPVTRHTRRVLHVQSISSWAPSCIGPYSQATSYRGLVYLAGVIPLDPPVMTLVPGDITAQVLRAMMSCEAVAVAQRTTVVGAALGLTVYLAAAVGGGSAVSGNLTPGSLGGLGGGGAAALERSGMNFSGSGGAELRALTRSAVEAILEHGLPGYSQSPYRQNNVGPPSAGSGSCGSSSRYHRSLTCESGIATPRTSHGTWPGAAGQGRVSAPPSRRSMLLGADGLDEEEEEAERAAVAAVTSGAPAAGFFGGRVTSGGQLFATTPVLDPYLQPPEVRVSIRPSVLYVTVPSLPRGSLVEIQPVCLDVEALSVIRKLAGHDSFVKRRNSSQHDALHQSAHNQHHGNINTQINHHSTAAAGLPMAQPPAVNAHGPVTAVGVLHSSPTAGGGGGTAAIGSITSWSELPPTPRASLESLTGRDGGGGGGGGSSHNNILHPPPSSGSSPMHWQVSADLLAMGQLASPLPSHMLSATGFMSPEAGCSLAGTPSGVPFALSRQRSSAVGLLAMSGSGNAGAGACGGYVPAGFNLRAGSSSNLYQRCLSPSPQPLPSSSSPQVPAMQAGLMVPAPTAAAVAGGPLQLPMLQTPPHPPLSAQNSSHQLLSPTLQHLLQMQLSPPMLLQSLQQATMDAPPLQQFQQLQIQQQRQSLARSTPMGAVSRRRRVSSSNGGAAPSRDTLEAAATTGMAGRASYSGSSSSNSGPLGHHRSSLDGNILSFEVSSGRGGPPVVVSPLPHSVPHSVNAASLADVPATLPATVAGAVASGGNGHAATVRTRPTAITVPQSSVGGSLIQRSPFESAVGTAAGAAAAAGMALSAPEITTDVAVAMFGVGGASPLLSAPTAFAMAGRRPPPSHFPPALTIPPQSSGGSGSDSTPTPGHHAAVAGTGTPPVPELPTAPSGAGARLGAAHTSGSSSGKSSSSDVMVTTVCCYGQVLRSLFHLPPAVFAPGVTTAQLTRRFRRAAASVLAAHGMDMSCLIWVRLWYEKGSVEFTDDEYGTVKSSTPQASMLAAVPAGSGVHHGAAASAASAAAAAIPVGGSSDGIGPRVLHALENGVDDDSGDGGGGGNWHRGKSLRSASCNSDSNSGGGAATNQNGATAHALGSSTVSCASQRPSASPRLVSTAEVGEVANGPPGGAGSPRCHSGSPAAGAVSSSAHNRRLSGVQPDTLTLDDRQGQQSHHHHHHHHHSQHHSHPHTHGLSHPHHHHHHQQQGPKDGSTNGLGQGQGQGQPPQPPPQPPLQQQHFHVSWVPVQRVATNASPQLAQCVAVLELLAALPTP